MNLANVNLEQNNEVIHLTWDDNSSARYHALWLRDNAQDEHTRSASNGQRLITLADIDSAIRVKEASIKEGQLALCFEPCNTTSLFSAQWLREHCYDRDHERVHGRVPDACELFDRNLSLDAVTGDFNELINDEEALLSWLSTLARFGFARLLNGPKERVSLRQTTLPIPASVCRPIQTIPIVTRYRLCSCCIVWKIQRRAERARL